MKIEIDIRNDIKPEMALEAVKQVVKNGKISNGENGKKYYCWATTFDCSDTSGDYKMVVYTRQYRKNDCFVVYKEGKYHETKK